MHLLKASEHNSPQYVSAQIVSHLAYFEAHMLVDDATSGALAQQVTHLFA